ncbi:MAG: hypothetical protein SFZ23_11785 [Planctomycetota bacterium]|nr:hypothetical protein [Planctomycetota bacterium]
MPTGAKVNSLEAMKEARLAYVQFAEDCVAALSAIDAEVQRVGRWLTDERPAYWRREVRKAEEEVNEWRKEISRKQLMRLPDPVSIVDERKKMRKAEARAQHCQQKLAVVQKWAAAWEREVMLYKSSLSSLNEIIHGKTPAATTRLDRMMQSIEEYLALQAPEAPGREALPGSSSVAEPATDEGSKSPFARPPTDPANSTPDARASSDEPRTLRDVYRRLRALAPDAAARAALNPRPIEGLERAPLMLTPEDEAGLKRLALLGVLPSASDRVVVAVRVLHEPFVAMIRLADAPPGDSGWYLGPSERPDATGGLRATSVGELLAARPDWNTLLSLRAGSLLVVHQGVIRCALDENDIDAWLQQPGT